MNSIKIRQLNAMSHLSELDSLEQELVNGGFFFGLSFSKQNIKLTEITELKNLYTGGNAPNLKNQVVATSGSTVIIDSGIPLPF